ncbi:MAG TPA: beta-ketoacyl-ACP synthase III [Gemmatimonadaceae bacterium]|nr:beta-ketoacyl-ACP synthase III [Gemmatimonadaceae bacterium]
MKRPVAQLMATGRAVPERVMTNYDFAAVGIETTHEWIMERTGIAARRIASEEETLCSLASAAARTAMERAEVLPGELDIIILATASPDRLLPATSVDIQAELGATRAAAFDLSAACSGWLYGLTVGEGMISSGAASTVLVIGAERMSKIIDWKDRATCVLFGDGAGATVLKRSTKGRGILSSYMRSDGRLAELLYRPAGGGVIPMSKTVLDDRSYLVKMAGREVFKHAVRSMSDACDHSLDGARLTGADIDLLIPHQANVRIIEATAKHAGIPMDKVFVNVDRYGNTSAASIPISLDEVIESGRVKEGSTVLLAAFGAGFTWASMVLRF